MKESLLFIQEIPRESVEGTSRFGQAPAKQGMCWVFTVAWGWDWVQVPEVEPGICLVRISHMCKGERLLGTSCQFCPEVEQKGKTEVGLIKSQKPRFKTWSQALLCKSN